MGTRSFRPTVTGNVHAVSSGQYLATAAGFRILEQGGNAIDAGVAAGIAINVVLPASTSFGGVAPILIYNATDKKVHSISGLGRWPAEASASFFIERRGGKMAPGVERCVVPAAAHAWMTALIEHGTMSFEQVVTPALELARDGFIVSQTLANNFAGCVESFEQWPTSAAIYAPNGGPLQQGEVSVNTALARTFERLIATEKANARLGREEAICAAKEYFYEGPIAEELVSFVREAGGFLSMRTTWLRSRPGTSRRCPASSTSTKCSLTARGARVRFLPRRCRCWPTTTSPGWATTPPTTSTCWPRPSSFRLPTATPTTATPTTSTSRSRACSIGVTRPLDDMKST